MNTKSLAVIVTSLALTSVHGERSAREQVATGLVARKCLQVKIQAAALTLGTDGNEEAALTLKDGVIRVPVPNYHQPNGWTCGAAALHAVCEYFGTGPTELMTYIKQLGTTKEDGTEPEAIRDYAVDLGFNVDMKIGMTIAELKKCLDQHRPVICEVQAWSSNPRAKKPDIYYTTNKNGHYIVAVGYDENNIYFEDPSTLHALGFIPTTEFDRRWHEKDKSGLHEHLGIVIWQKEGKSPYLSHAEKID